MSEFSPRTPEEVFQNFKGRQAGINKALNDDVVRARASEPRSLFFLLLQFALKNSSLILKMQIHRARSHASRYRFEKFGNRFRRVISIWVQIERSKRKSKSVPATYSFENTQTNFARIYYFSPRDALFENNTQKRLCDDGRLRRRTVANALIIFAFESRGLNTFWCGSRIRPVYLSSI